MLWRGARAEPEPWWGAAAGAGPLAGCRGGAPLRGAGGEALMGLRERGPGGGAGGGAPARGPGRSPGRAPCSLPSRVGGWERRSGAAPRAASCRPPARGGRGEPRCGALSHRAAPPRKEPPPHPPGGNYEAAQPAAMYPTCRTRRGVAQLGSASALGAEGRGFKSRHPDHPPATGPASPHAARTGRAPRPARTRPGPRHPGPRHPGQPRAPIRPGHGGCQVPRGRALPDRQAADAPERPPPPAAPRRTRRTPPVAPGHAVHTADSRDSRDRLLGR